MENMASLIQSSLPPQTSLIRVHVSGDFFNESYFLAWLNVAWNNPHITFYGYTKMLPFFVKYKKHTPANFRFTASKGGKADNLISKHRLKFAEVVYSPEEASAKGLSIDHDDSLAIGSNTSFALLLHGNQKANSSASVAWQSLIKRGIGGYGKNDKKGFRNKTMEKELVIHIALKNGEIFLPKTVDKSYNFVPTTDPKINAPLS